MRLVRVVAARKRNHRASTLAANARAAAALRQLEAGLETMSMEGVQLGQKKPGREGAGGD